MLKGHSVSFSPDGSLLASATFDGIKLWDIETHENIGTLLEGVAIADVSFSPDGSLLACGLESGTILWDIEKNSTIAFFADSFPVTSVSFAPDGSLLASSSFFSSGIKLWDVTSYIDQLESKKIAEDVNADGVINIQDLVLVASNFGETGETAADVNGDGIVDIRDLVRVAGAFGTSAAAPSLHPQSLEILTAADVKLWLSQAQHLNLSDATSQRGIGLLEQLLIVLTPKKTTLLPNYPNPFNPETWIPYRLAKPADVQITIYGVNGALVRTLALGHQLPGIYQNRSRAAYWDGRNAVGESVASGLYFYTLTAGDFISTRKMLIRK